MHTHSEDVLNVVLEMGENETASIVIVITVLMNFNVRDFLRQKFIDLTL